MRFNASTSGKVGLGLGTSPSTSSDAPNLHVKASRAMLQLENTSAGQWAFVRLGGDSANYWDMARYGTETILKFRYKGSNKVTFDKDGNITAKNVSASCSRELKTNIQHLDEQDCRALLDSVRRLPVFRYQYKHGDVDEKPQLGVIAEECPEDALDETGKAARSPAFIDTHCKRGYRLVAPVKNLPGAGGQHRPFRPRLVVLPFRYFGTDPAQRFLACAVTDMTHTALARCRPIQVLSRASVSSWSGARQPPPLLSEIVASLEVDRLLEGALIRVSEKTQITVRLYSAEEENLWADFVEESGTDDLTVLRKLAEAVAQKVIESC